MFDAKDDNVLGGDRVAVLSHGFWIRRFQSSASVIGRTIQYKETPYTVIGVAQAGFTGVEAETSIDVWVPITADAQRAWLTSAHNHWLRILMRLNPGTNSADVQGALDGVFRAHVARDVLPGVPPHFQRILEAQHIRLRPAGSGLSTLGRRYEKPLQLLMAVVALVLLISCANVANLVLARNAARQHEITLRLALGASRGRILSQLFVESLLLALSGAAAGVALAVWANGALISLLPEPQVPLALDLRPDRTVLGFTSAVAVATALVFGLAPALRAYRTSRDRALNSGRRTTGHSLTGRLLVLAQLGLSLLLLIGAGLFLETIRNLKAIDLGFRPENLLTFDVSFPRGTPAERIRQTYQQIQERLASRPGVMAASYSAPGLYEGGGWSSPMETEERRAAPGEDNEVALMAVGPGFVRTIGLELRQGRDLTAYDHSGPPVAVVNETLARRYFGPTSPIGRRIRLPGNQPELREIVGVVGDARHLGARERVWPQVYLPQTMQGSLVVVRSTADARLAGPSIREVVLAVNGTAQVERVQQLDAIVDGTLQQGATDCHAVDELCRPGSSARGRRPLWSDCLQPRAANDRARHSDGPRRPTGPHPVARVAGDASGPGDGSRRRRGRGSCVDSLRVKPALWSQGDRRVRFHRSDVATGRRRAGRGAAPGAPRVAHRSADRVALRIAPVSWLSGPESIGRSGGSSPGDRPDARCCR